MSSLRVELEQRAQRLRAAGTRLQSRSASEVLAVLCDLLDAWSDPASVWRTRLERELPGATGFSPEVVREGLSRGLAAFTGDRLRELVARELRPGDLGFPLTSVLLAGSIPMPSLLSLVLPLVLRSPVLAKTASRDPVSPHVFAETIGELDAELRRCIDVVSFPGEDADCSRVLLSSDCVVATGSDETMSEIERRVPAHTRLIRHGHAMSVAALGPETDADKDLSDAAVRLALDISLWDQLGCLSPLAVFVEDAAGGRSEQLAASLADALAHAQERLPRGEIAPASAAAIAHERDEARMRAAAGQRIVVHASADTSWTAVLEPDAQWRPVPLHRFVRIHPVDSREALLEALAPLHRHLACVGLEGFAEAGPEIARTLCERGASRVCRFGEMQSPPLGWERGNSPLCRPLVQPA